MFFSRLLNKLDELRFRIDQLQDHGKIRQLMAAIMHISSRKFENRSPAVLSIVLSPIELHISSNAKIILQFRL